MRSEAPLSMTGCSTRPTGKTANHVCREPADILDSFAGEACANPRYLWNALRVSTAPLTGNEPGGAPLRG